MPDNSNLNSRRRSMMLNNPISKLIPKMAVPTVVAMLITALYNMADAYFVSSLGTSATAAVGVNMTIDHIIMMGGSFLAIGANSYIARLLGAKQNKKASATLSNAFFTALAIGVVIAAVGLIFIKRVVVFLGATETSVQYAMDYASYILVAAPFMTSSFVLNQCLRSEGSPVYSMIGMGIGGLLNIGLDPLFIFTFDMGVAGAAIATAISKFIGFCILIAPYLLKKSVLRISFKNISFSSDIVREISFMGLPSLLRFALQIVASVLMNNLAGNYSDSALAGISVVNRIMMIPGGIVLGYGQGFMPVAGYNWGAKRFDRVKRSYTFSSVSIFALIMAMSAVMVIFSEQIILLFTEGDAEMVRIGSFSLIAQSLVMPLNALVIILNMYYSALGKPIGAIIQSLSRQGYCFIPLFFILSGIYGIMGLAAVQAAADLLSFVVSIPFAIHIVRFVSRAEKNELQLPEDHLE
ncbi:MAG: MATE family efflux transporter [Clostridiales bacterium]|nr:MATE family efflux transporter [Clostridiales bacterium]